MSGANSLTTFGSTYKTVHSVPVLCLSLDNAIFQCPMPKGKSRERMEFCIVVVGVAGGVWFTLRKRERERRGERERQRVASV